MNKIQINPCCRFPTNRGHWLAYAAIFLILHMASKLQALSLVGCEGAEADALDFAGDFELDLGEMILVFRLGLEVCFEVTHPL